MIGALAIKNRRKKLGVSEEPLGPPPRNIYFQRCHLLYVIAGCSFIVGLVLLIPGFFGDSPFFIYASSSLGLSIVCFLIACLMTPLSDDLESTATVNANTEGVTTATDTDLESGAAMVGVVSKAAQFNPNKNTSRTNSRIDLMAGSLSSDSPAKKTTSNTAVPLTVIEGSDDKTSWTTILSPNKRDISSSQHALYTRLNPIFF